jgi:hypothetical protein
MVLHSPRSGVPLLYLALTACSGAATTVGAPTPVPSGATSQHSITFAPATLRPEALPGSCVPHPAPFGTRLIVNVNPGSDVVLRSLRFRFTDRTGASALPHVRPIPGASPMTMPSTSIPPFSPIPVPGGAPLTTTGPIPIPGSSTVDGLMVPGGSTRSLPFFLAFDCGVVGDGTLFIMFDTADMMGGRHSSQLTARVSY